MFHHVGSFVAEYRNYSVNVVLTFHLHHGISNKTNTYDGTNNGEILGNEIELNEAHGSSVRETENFARKEATVRDFCNRLKKMTSWIKTNYIDYKELLSSRSAAKKKHIKQDTTPKLKILYMRN